MAVSLSRTDEIASSSCDSPNKNRHRARPSNDIIAEHQDTEKCLVTGDSATESPVHLCHVFPECHWTNHPLLSRLEWAWGMKYDSIQMDTDSNTIPLRHDWRKLFESDRWALMPSMNVIDKLWDRWIKFPLSEGNILSIEDMYDGAETFEYRLVPLFPDIPPISRRNKAGNVPEGKCDEDTGAVIYSYPFDTLPPIFSRVKPHFVAYDAGRKLGLRLPKWSTITSLMARTYGVSRDKADFANTVVLQTYCTWNRPAHPANFMTSPRRNDSRPRSGLITTDQPSAASQRASRPPKRFRTTGDVEAMCPQPHVVQYATCLSRVSPCGSDVVIVGDSGWDIEVDPEFEKIQLRRVIKVVKRWVRDCKRED